MKEAKYVQPADLLPNREPSNRKESQIGVRSRLLGIDNKRIACGGGGENKGEKPDDLYPLDS